MDFELSEEHKEFQKHIRSFVELEIRPLVKESEDQEKFPTKLFQRMGEKKLLGVSYPVEYSGRGVDEISECIYSEELGRVCCGIATGLVLQTIATYPIYVFGTSEQKEKFIGEACRGEKVFSFALTEPNAGSDVQGIETTAVRSNGKYVINGSKMFIGNGPIADYALVAAYVKKERGINGIGLFIVDTKTPGFSANKLHKLGNRSNESAELVFKDVEVPEKDVIGKEAGGFSHLLQSLKRGRFIVAARNIGVAQASFEECCEYAKVKLQNGKLKSKSQAVRFKLAEMATLIAAARLMNYQVAWLYGSGRIPSVEASMAKLFSTEMAQWVTNEAMDIYGEDGNTMESNVQRYFRDARAGTIVEGSSEIQHTVIAKEIGL
jgi:acyl-CoA dehydrogenase